MTDEELMAMPPSNIPEVLEAQKRAAMNAVFGNAARLGEGMTLTDAYIERMASIAYSAMIKLSEDPPGTPVMNWDGEPVTWGKELEPCKNMWRAVIKLVLSEHHRRA